jgi:hypothetical protein
LDYIKYLRTVFPQPAIKFFYPAFFAQELNALIVSTYGFHEAKELLGELLKSSILGSLAVPTTIRQYRRGEENELLGNGIQPLQN